jgi:hypothetical protein
VERRWILRLAPPIAALAAVGVLATTSSGATGRARELPPCDGAHDRVAAAARAAPPLTLRAADGATRYRLEPRLDPGGTLEGQRLRIDAGGRDPISVDLHPESAAAGPFGALVLVVDDDGHRSTVRAIDGGAGCAVELGQSDDVVRRATLAPTGDAVYEFRVERETRRDLGVWRRPVNGSGERQILAAPPDDREFGVTWTTTLAGSADGESLVVQSCGPRQCRSRIVASGSGDVEVVAGHGQGQLIGLADGVLVTHAACTGLPCPVLGIDVQTGRSRTIADAAGLATLIQTPAGPRVVSEAGRGVLAIHRVDGRFDRHVSVADAGLRLVTTADRARGAMRLPPGSVLRSPDGRPTPDAVITRLADGASVRLSEVVP